MSSHSRWGKTLTLPLLNVKIMGIGYHWLLVSDLESLLRLMDYGRWTDSDCFPTVITFLTDSNPLEFDSFHIGPFGLCGTLLGNFSTALGCHQRKATSNHISRTQCHATLRCPMTLSITILQAGGLTWIFGSLKKLSATESCWRRLLAGRPRMYWGGGAAQPPLPNATYGHAGNKTSWLLLLSVCSCINQM